MVKLKGVSTYPPTQLATVSTETEFKIFSVLSLEVGLNSSPCMINLSPLYIYPGLRGDRREGAPDYYTGTYLHGSLAPQEAPSCLRL